MTSEYRDKTDAELVALARGGEREAFGQLVERYEQMARRIAFGMVANEEVARELAQEAILAAYLSLAHLRDEARFRSWLYGIVLNVCRSHLRERKGDPYSLEELMEVMGGMRYDLSLFTQATVDPQRVAEERELQRSVLEAVQHLSPKDRAATLLFYYEQLSLEEIARVSGASVTAVKGRLHRARKQLRMRLSPLYSGSINSATPVAPASQAQGRKTMIAAHIHAVQEIPETKQTVVILQEEAGKRLLLIWVGRVEGMNIAMGITGMEAKRPMSAHLMADLLKVTGAQLEEVRIEALKDEIFYAVMKVRNGSTAQELDARPSDALALAAIMGNSTPIFIAEDVMERAGVTMPEGRVLRTDMTDLATEREAVQKKLDEYYSSFSIPQAVTEREEMFKQAKQQIIDFLTEEQV